MLSVWRPAEAKALVTGPEVRAFLGGRTGKVAFIRDYTYQIYYLDFDDSVLVEHRVATTEAANPMISWDGTRVLYERFDSVFVRDLVENSQTEYAVYCGSVDRPSGESLEPHWWVQPGTGNEYVTYTLGDINDPTWPPASGGTYIRRIVNGHDTLGPATMLVPYLMSTGRSRDGRWGASSHHSTGMYELDSTRIDTAYLASKNWLTSGWLSGCNASISMSTDPTRQDRMMYLTSGQGTVEGKVYDNHKAIFIRGWNDPDIDHPFWYMGIPGDNCNNDSSGNLFWGNPEWSTDEDYFTATGSKDVDIADSGDLYIVRIDTSGPSRLLRVLEGDGVNLTPHLWVKNGVTPATLRLDRDAFLFTALPQDSADPGPDTTHVSNAGDGVLPPLTAAYPDSDTTWLRVTILANGTNAPQVVNTVTRKNLPLGSYRARVVLSYGQGVDSAAYTVTFLYANPALTTLVPRPHTAVLRPGDTVQLAADGKDQIGRPWTLASPLTWTGSSGLHLTSGGQATADSSQVFHTFSAYGSEGAVVCTTSVVVAKGVWRYAAEPALGAGWLPDTSLLGTMPLVRQSDTIVQLDSVIDPAPAVAYRLYRNSPSGLTLPVPNNRYHVRLHFTSLNDASAKATSSLSVGLEGQTIGAPFAAPAKPAGAIGAMIFETDVTVSDSNGLGISLSAADGGGYGLAAIEAYSDAPTPVQVNAPNGGEQYRVGDSLIVRWTADTSWVLSVGIELSVDSGASWIPLTRTSSVRVGDADWGRFAFQLPDSLDGKSLVSNRCLVTVYEYFGRTRDLSDHVFQILPGNAGVRPSSAAKDLVLQNLGNGRFRLFGLSQAAQLTVTPINGHGVSSLILQPASDGSSVDLHGLSEGLVVLQLRQPDGHVWRRLVLNAH